MRITVAFDVKNHVEVPESWPLKSGDRTFFLERDGDALKRVCLTFSGVGIEHAPSIASADSDRSEAHITINGGIYASMARQSIMNWQAVLSGLQIVDLDYDNYEMMFTAETLEEEPRVQIKSFKTDNSKALNSPCEYEQIGRAFLTNPIPDDRIESISHFREGRIAAGAGRYVDAYNNMFLFLETRYCDGKTKTEQQVALLSKERLFCDALEETCAEFVKRRKKSSTDKFDLFTTDQATREKIKVLVLLRGKLRHHSLKSPHRWDPNKQEEYESAARFLGAVVGNIVLKESLDDIYKPATMEKFRRLAISTGHESKIRLTTYRLEAERAVALEMSYPTTLLSSSLCLAVAQHALQECERQGQLADTVKLEAKDTRSDLELFSLDLGVWAYTKNRVVETSDPSGAIRCSFEHQIDGLVTRNEFSIPMPGDRIGIMDVWHWLKVSVDHIQDRNPTTRIMALKLLLSSTKTILTYRVGAQVKN